MLRKWQRDMALREPNTTVSSKQVQGRKNLVVEEKKKEQGQTKRWWWDDECNPTKKTNDLQGKTLCAMRDGNGGTAYTLSLIHIYVFLTRVFSMANDNSRKFKQNQIIFYIQPWFVEYSRPIVFGEDRLRGRGSLAATFFFYGKR